MMELTGDGFAPQRLHWKNRRMNSPPGSRRVV
jgi:hypothetical protein